MGFKDNELAWFAVDQNGNAVTDLKPGLLGFAQKKMKQYAVIMDDLGLKEGRKTLRMADGTIINLKPISSFNKIQIMVPIFKQKEEETVTTIIPGLFIAPEYQIATGWHEFSPSGWRLYNTDFVFSENIEAKSDNAFGFEEDGITPINGNDYLGFPMIEVGIGSAKEYDESKLTRVQDVFPSFEVVLGEPVIESNSPEQEPPYPIYDFGIYPWPTYSVPGDLGSDRIDGSFSQDFEDISYTQTITTPWSLNKVIDGVSTTILSGSIVETQVTTGTTRYWLVHPDDSPTTTWVWIGGEGWGWGPEMTLEHPDWIHPPSPVASRDEITVQIPSSIVVGWFDSATADYAYILRRVSDYSYVSDDSGETGGDYTTSFYFVSNGVESLIWTSPTLNFFTDPTAPGASYDFKVYREGKDDFFVVFCLNIDNAGGPM